MVNFAFDYTGDGWDDVLVVESRPTVLYVNPKGVSRRWDRFTISPAVTSENIVFRDLDNDKKPEVISVGGGVVQYIKPDPANPTGMWTQYVVSEPGPWGVHGVGSGDINGDGRVDILTAVRLVRAAGNRHAVHQVDVSSGAIRPARRRRRDRRAST